MSYRKGIIPAFKLRKQSKGDGFIEDYVNDNLGLIEDSIISANERKQLYAVTEIPTNYDVPFMDNARAQKHIYFHTLKALKSAEYKPSLRLDGKDHRQRAYVIVRWVTKDDIDEEKYMDEFLTAHSVQPKTIQQSIIATNNPIIRDATRGLTIEGLPGTPGSAGAPTPTYRRRRRRQ
jgi:hypothetical protein